MSSNNRQNPTRETKSRGNAAKSVPGYAAPNLWTKNDRGGGRGGAHTATGNVPQSIPQKLFGVLAVIGIAAGKGAIALLRAFISLLMRSRAALIVFLVIVVVGGGALIDFGLNNGKAYPGVHVGMVDVSGKTEDEIVSLVSETYQPRVDSTQVSIYASQDAKQSVSDAAAQAQDAALAQQLSVEEARANRQLWTTDAATLSASLPVHDLAQQALEVGRSEGGVLARVSALFVGWTVQPYLSYNDSAIESLASEIDSSIGNPRVDYGVSVSNGRASVTEGHDGMMVDRSWFADQLNAAFLSNDDPSFIAQAQYAALRIDQSAAQAACDRINSSIEHGVVFTYEGASWSMSASVLGGCIATRIDESDGGYAITPYVDETKAKPLILSQAQQHHDGALSAVSFQRIDDGSIVVTTDGTGEVPLTAEAVAALNEVLFNGMDQVDVDPISETASSAGATHAEKSSDSGAVSVTLVKTAAPTQLSFDDAVSAGVVSVVSSFTTEYSSGAGTENRNHNIHLVSDLLNGSITRPGEVWSYNGTAGNCNEEAGFLGAGSIVDGEYTEEVGGGICQVATTVFNAVYEAGLPVVSRSNHSLYIASYPAGRDAAVSWPDLDLKWSNDSQSDILLLMTYDDTSVTATLYGVPLGYTVTSEVGEWSEGEKYDTRTEVDDTLAPGTSYVKTAGSDGRSISVVRTVTDSDGNIVRQDRFDSVYDPITEVVVKGPDADNGKEAGQNAT